MAKPTAEVFVVSLKAEGAGPPPIIRLKRFLKTALRSHKLRAVSVVELKASTK